MSDIKQFDTITLVSRNGETLVPRNALVLRVDGNDPAHLDTISINPDSALRGGSSDWHLALDRNLSVPIATDPEFSEGRVGLAYVFGVANDVVTGKWAPMEDVNTALVPITSLIDLSLAVENFEPEANIAPAFIISTAAKLLEDLHMQKLATLDKDEYQGHNLFVQAAIAAHESNRVLCLSMGDDSQPTWENAPEWQKESALAGVMAITENHDMTPEQSHESWTAVKVAEGWKYGPVKNTETKEHPCLVPYGQLPAPQQYKDHLFGVVVRSVLGIPLPTFTPAVAPLPAPILPSAEDLDATEADWDAKNKTEIAPSVVYAVFIDSVQVGDPIPADSSVMVGVPPATTATLISEIKVGDVLEGGAVVTELGGTDAFVNILAASKK